MLHIQHRMLRIHRPKNLLGGFLLVALAAVALSVPVGASPGPLPCGGGQPRADSAKQARAEPRGRIEGPNRMSDAGRAGLIPGLAPRA